MKPTYNPGQAGFDFGESALVNDVGTVIDMKEFPNIGIEDVFEILKNNRVEHVLNVYRIAMEIWEDVLDEEIVKELRNSNDFPAATKGAIAGACNVEIETVESELEFALNALKDALDRLEVVE